MKTHGERSRHRRSVQLEFLENRSLLSQLTAISPTAEVRSDPPTVPFRMTFEGTRSPTTINGRPGVRIEGEGHATLFGTYHLVQEHTVLLNLDTHQASIPASETDPPGQATLTLDNGDQVFADCTGSGTIDQTNTIVHFPNLKYTITGGTGREDGVSGTFFADVTVNLGTGTVTATGKGEISPAPVGSLLRQ